MGNSVSSTSGSWSLSPTSHSSGSISSSLSTIIPDSPSTIATLANTAESGPPCGSSGSPCCVSLECSEADSGYGTTLTTTVTSEECTDEPEAETASSSSTSATSTSASFTCVDWSCISSVVGEAGSSLCATTYTPWIQTTTVYEWCPETSRHHSLSWSPETFSAETTTTTTTTTTTASASSHTTPDWPWPSTFESCDYEDPRAAACLSTSSTTRFHFTPATHSSQWHHSPTTESPGCAYEDCAQGARTHLHSLSRSRSRHFTVKTPPGTCHPPHCGAPPTESTGSEVWPQTTMPTARTVRSSAEAELSGA